MLKEHKNQWFHTITNSEMGLENFTVTEPNNHNLVIKLNNSPLVFMIRQDNEDFDKFSINFSKYSPNFPLIYPANVFEKHTTMFSADDVYIALSQWLGDTARRYIDEVQLPDLWSQSKTYSAFSNNTSIPKEELLPFTDEEKISVKEGLKNFEGLLIEKFDPVEEQLKIITERLDYLSTSVDRLNRFDWKAQALSTLTSIAINLGVDTETGSKLMLMFQQALVYITKYLPPSVHFAR